MSQHRLVDSHTFTEMSDLKSAKGYLIGGGWDTLFAMTDYFSSNCHAHPTSDVVQVRTVSYGRLRSADICDRCLAIEKQFLDTLIAFDDAIQYDFDGGEVINEVRDQNRAFAELQQKHKLSKDEKRRKELEAQGQGRLF